MQDYDNELTNDGDMIYEKRRHLEPFFCYGTVASVRMGQMAVSTEDFLIET